MRRLVVIAAAATLALGLLSPARSDAPLRSGAITGWGYTSPAMFSGEVRNCQWNEVSGVWGSLNAECRVWLDAGCDPALAGRDPAVTASILDISELADGAATRTFEWDAVDDHGGVVVQLWTADCTEIAGTEWRSLDRQGRYCCSWIQHKTTAFVIPRDATWMTVTTNDTFQVEWTLS